MKFSLFVHMERFRPDTPHARLLDEMVELTEMAEAAGFETVWIGEHHAMEFTIAPNPFVQLAYLAPRTKRIRLGTGNCIAPFWHPIKLAGEAAMLDVMSGGRLDLGVARGAYTFEYDRVMPGLDAMGAGLRMRELVPAVKKLWAGDYAHQGEYWQWPSTSIVPSPVQKPGPPIWIAARDPNSHAFAVKEGCNVQVTPLAAGDGEVADLMKKFNAACAAAPAVPRPQIMLLQHCFAADSEREADQFARDLSRYYAYFFAWFKNERPIRQGFIAELSEAEIAALPQYAPETIRKNLVVDTPDAVIARLKAFEAMGYDQYSLWIDSLVPHARKKASLALFIKDVMPAFG
jgi:alkanesulfonate monooxygenase SsuD/methylene tetrahydromethanopterin reductase-like flavin-dependent oxidoreductase (luciferase family)